MVSVKTNPKITLLIIIIGGFLFYYKFQLNWILISTLFIAFIGFISKEARNHIDFLWMKLAWVLSLIVPKIVLSIVFYFLLFPIAFISRIVGAKNGFDLKNNKESFFKTTTKEFDKDFFEKPW